MQHSNHRTAALIASKPARIITSAALAVTLTAAPMLSPVAAYAASQATQDQLSAAQQKIETATSAYNEARTKLEDLQKQIDTNEASIEKIEAELPDQQAKASSAMRDLYKYQKGTNPIVSFLVNAQSLGEFITTCKYTNQITSSSVDEIEELNKMQTELEQNKTELEQAKSQLETEQKTAEDALAQAQQLRSEAQAKAEQENAAELAKLEADKAAAAEAVWLADLAAWLEGGKPARSFDFDESDDAVKAARKELGLLSAKPVIYACNVGEDDLLGGLDENPYFPLVAARAKEENAQAIPICAKTEEDIAGSTQEEKIAFLQEMGIESTGLDKLIKASYELLGLISFLTDGKKECRAWTIRKGTKAPQAAGKIHSDFERGFIRAQVIAYKDLEDADFNYAAVKAKGLQRTEGKEYVVNDGDVIEFLFNV